MGAVDALLWNPVYWLPEGLTWDDLQPEEGKTYPQSQDIWIYPLLFALILNLFRAFILNPLILKPIAKFLKLQYKKAKPPAPNSDLEHIFLDNNGCVPPKVIAEASVSLQLTRREIERWLRDRSSMTRLTKLDKFQESAFILLYHVLITVYGFQVMWSKPWLWDITLCYKHFPFHDIDVQVWWYYMIGCGFYWSMAIWQYKYSHGHDAKMAFVHHMCTIFLMISSWKCNYVRIGTVVLFLHECGDIPLHLGKILRYLKERVLIDYVFGVFVILWFTTRLVMFPFWVLHSLFVEMPKYVGIPALTVFHVLLVLLFLMNIVWSAFIASVVYSRLTSGVVKNTISSDDENNESFEDDKEKEILKQTSKVD
ncbi:TRAM/LAG1/CLN8 domain [Trinorchestia longiramus]|nr:TRAM/LAG1/CLN8 domain [Trinorchestia longiramus]